MLGVHHAAMILLSRRMAYVAGRHHPHILLTSGPGLVTLFWWRKLLEACLDRALSRTDRCHLLPYEHFQNYQVVVELPLDA